MNRKPSRGIVGYVVLLSTLLLIAILLNGGLSQTVSRRIEYPQLLEMIKAEAPCQLEARSTLLCGSSIAEDHPLVQRARELGIPTVGSPTLSNQALCRFPSVKIGPGDSVRSHTADEYVNVADIEKATNIYVQLLDGLKV